MNDLSKLEYGTPIEVLWGDAWSNDTSYYRKGEDYSPKKCRNMGYFMEINDTSLVFSWSIGAEDNDNRGLSIFSVPLDWVIDVWIIKE